MPDALTSPAAATTPLGLEAFTQLYEEHAGMLLGFLTTRCRSHSDAVDLAQEAWMRVWKSMATQFDGTNFRAWLYEIARNVLIDSGRRKRPTPVAELPEVVARPDRDDSRETAAALTGCLEKLSEEH